uniref:Rhodanese domain-containing protein n=1 Tax=Populus davidiana TaxID=266767 RepID=A0A6M2F145_9ROSI
MPSYASSALLVRSMRSLFRPFQRGITSRVWWPGLVVSFHVAKGNHRTGVRDRVLNFGSIADDNNENNTKTQSFNVQPRSVPVHVAHELLQVGHQYLDVRTHDEFRAGHPSGAINIPYMLNNGAEMFKNSKFLEEVSSQFGKDDDIVVGCKSGRRSLMAASDLQSAGFNRVIDVAGGYTAWTENGLPIAK